MSKRVTNERPPPLARRAGAATTIVLASLLLAAGCADDEEASALPTADRPPSATATPAAPRGDPSTGTVDPSASEPLLDRLGEAPTAEEEAAAESMPAPLGARAAPPRGCALQVDAPLRVLTSGGPPAIVAAGDAFLVAAYDQQGVAIVRARPGALPEPFAALPLDANGARGAAPALAHTGDREVTVAMIDGRGRVLAAAFDPQLPATAPITREIAAAGADARFAPVVRAIATRRVIAWTDGSATPMRLKLAIVENDAVLTTHDVTPVAGGGAAPFFVEGESDAVLLFLDPRVGISVAHRVRLGADGTPGPTEVARPLNLAAEPPAIAVAHAPGAARTWLAYAAVGNLATRAVGLVDATGTERPSPLVPGVGYGDPLTIDAVIAGRSVVFAVEAPTATTREAPHEVRLRVVDDGGAGDPLVLAAPATDPAIARREDGLLAIAYRSGSAVLVHFARCAE